MLLTFCPGNRRGYLNGVHGTDSGEQILSALTSDRPDGPVDQRWAGSSAHFRQNPNVARRDRAGRAQTRAAGQARHHHMAETFARPRTIRDAPGSPPFR